MTPPTPEPELVTIPKFKLFEMKDELDKLKTELAESIPIAKVQELSKELNEASFLSHEQRYKASAMVDKLLSSGKEKP